VMKTTSAGGCAGIGRGAACADAAAAASVASSAEDAVRAITEDLGSGS